MMTARFTGPLFIVGMARSGTKLLRDLLNQNPGIGITVEESAFIPYMVERFGNPPRFEDDYEFQQFYEALTQTIFFWYMERVHSCLLTREYIDEVADKTSWSSIFRTILILYAPEAKNENFIWGDKSPNYLNHMDLLKELWPEARFLHIIRDFRDTCSSGMKVWGKSIYRSADRWRRTVSAARENGRKLGRDYMEVFYESLLEDPERVLSSICDFLDCKFIPAMVRLKKPSENLGDTKGQAQIVQDNVRKYQSRLSRSQIKRIEEIVYPVAKSTGYEPEYGAEFRPLNPLTLGLLKLHDGLALVKFSINMYGLRDGLWIFSRGWKSRWRRSPKTKRNL